VVAFDPVRREASDLEPIDFTVAVVDADQLFRTRLAMDLAQHIPASAFASIEAMEERIAPGTATVLLLGPSMADPIELASVERLGRTRPEIGPVLIVESLTTEVLQRALRAGVRDVLAAPLDNDQLYSAIDRVATSLATTPSSRPTGGAPSVGVSGAHPLGRVITVFSTKGGAGKSVLASNLAVILAKRSTRPVVLVDADLQFGDIAVMLKLAPQHTVVDAVNAMDRLDAQLLQNLLVKHESSGLYVLPAPLEPAFADQIGSGQMLRILELLREQAEFVVIDNVSLSEGADEGTLVVNLELSTYYRDEAR